MFPIGRQRTALLNTPYWEDPMKKSIFPGIVNFVLGFRGKKRRDASSHGNHRWIDTDLGLSICEHLLETVHLHLQIVRIVMQHTKKLGDDGDSEQ